VHPLDDPLINDNNRLFVEGGRKAGYWSSSFREREGLSARASAISAVPTRRNRGQTGSSCRVPSARGEVVTRARCCAFEPDRSHRPGQREGRGTRARPPSGRRATTRASSDRRGRAERSGLRPCCCAPAPRSPFARPWLHLSPGADPGGRSIHTRSPTTWAIPRATSSTMRVRALRARDLHVLSVRHGEEPDGLRRDNSAIMHAFRGSR